MGSAEKRRFRRYDVTGVEGTLILNLDVRVIDLSLTGMSVEAATALKPGAAYTVRLRREGEPLRFPATVRWCRLVRTEPNARGEVTAFYRAGLDFRDSLDEKARWILDFIERHIVLELDARRRVAGRFTVLASDDEVAVAHTGQFVTRKLSVSGMLVETRTRCELGALLDVEVRHERSPFTARARVADVHDGNGGGPDSPVELGLGFEDLSPEAREAVTAIIQEAL